MLIHLIAILVLCFLCYGLWRLLNELLDSAQRKKGNTDKNTKVPEVQPVVDRASVLDSKIEENSDEFRKIYNIPKEKELFYDEYRNSGIISSTNISVTNHESTVALRLIGNNYFDRRCVFLDSYYKQKNGHFAQIDIIAVNHKGIFVFETKDYNCWIFGNGRQQDWMQTYPNKEKYKFYNPIRQNWGHIQCLKEKTKAYKIPFYSVIVFGDNAELKNVSNIPKGTYIATSNRIVDLMNDIMAKEKDRLSGAEIIDLCRKINENKIEPTPEIREEHVEIIRDETGENRIYR